MQINLGSRLLNTYLNLLDQKELPLLIPGPTGIIEAVWHRAEANLANRVAIICHPHPLHGGTMDNKVVTTLMRCYRDLGVHVLRFNFRGVGKSEGSFDNAQGEREDLQAVIDWLMRQLPDAPLLLAGFSFGSSIAAQVSYRLPGLLQLTLVAPPIERYPYDLAGQFNAPLCVIQGDRDERVNAEGVYSWAAGLRGEVALLRYPEAGHFFHGFLTELKADLSRVLQQQLIPG